MHQLIGWSASAVLLATILAQIYRQWQQQSSRGVFVWLYIGQMFASVGFVWYSWLVHDWVFIATNAMLLLSAGAGLIIVGWHRRTRSDEQLRR